MTCSTSTHDSLVPSLVLIIKLAFKSMYNSTDLLSFNSDAVLRCKEAQEYQYIFLIDKSVL